MAILSEQLFVCESESERAYVIYVPVTFCYFAIISIKLCYLRGSVQIVDVWVGCVCVFSSA